MVWLLFFLLLILALGGVWWLRAVRSQDAEPLNAPYPWPRSPFGKAVSPVPVGKARPQQYWGKQLIVTDPEACPPAREMAGMYFRNGTAPLLPLPGCTRARCTCELNSVTERRSGEERRSGVERREDARFGERPDRRTGRDRRKDKDHYPWHSVS